MWKLLHPLHPVPCYPQILLQLQQLGDKMDSMDKRVQHTAAALGNSNSQVSQILSNSAYKETYSTVSNGNAIEEINSESVVSSVELLRQDDELQSEVDQRLAELRSLNESAI